MPCFHTKFTSAVVRLFLSSLYLFKNSQIMSISSELAEMRLCKYLINRLYLIEKNSEEKKTSANLNVCGAKSKISVFFFFILKIEYWFVSEDTHSKIESVQCLWHCCTWFYRVIVAWMIKTYTFIVYLCVGECVTCGFGCDVNKRISLFAKIIIW